MANTKPVGVAFSDPALTSGTTITGATISSSTFTGGAYNGTVGATTPSTASFTNETQNGTLTRYAQTLAAAGTTQGTAGAITKSVVIVTVTASAQGVKLPTAATGLEYRVHVPGTVGVTVYPFSGDKIDASSTNAGVVLAAGKANIYYARNTSQWVTMKGA